MQCFRLSSLNVSSNVMQNSPHKQISSVFRTTYPRSCELLYYTIYYYFIYLSSLSNSFFQGSNQCFTFPLNNILTVKLLMKCNVT